MIDRPEGYKEIVIRTSNPRVSCSGENNDHPLVYYDVPRDGTYVVCGYCDIKFVYEPDNADHWTDKTEKIARICYSRGFFV